jgi:flagellar hook-associated protein 3 FlgL
MTSTIRMTQASISRSVMTNLQAGLTKLSTLQEQLSSGRLINRPSDNPSGTVSAMQFRAEITRTTQYQRNCEDALGWLGAADDVLNSALGPMNRIRELAVSGISAASSPEARNALAAEVDQLREHLLTIANSRYLGRPLFGGTTGNADAYVKDALGTITFNGDTGNVTRSIAANTQLSVNLQAEDVFGAAGSDLFQVLADISDHLRNDPSQLGADLDKIDAANKRLLNALADVGARYHRVEAMREAAEKSLASLTNGLTEVENIDLPKTIIDLQLQEVAYQAALGAAARIIQPSLLDFLR